MHRAIQITMLAKSITTPLAMESVQVGGIPALAAVYTDRCSWSHCGYWCVCGPQCTKSTGWYCYGHVARAIGTAKAIQMGRRGGDGILGLCVNGIFTALALPVILVLFELSHWRSIYWLWPDQTCNHPPWLKGAQAAGKTRSKESTRADVSE